MAGENSIQILRGASTYDPKTREDILLDGQPFYSKKYKSLYIGDGTNKIKDLSPVANYDNCAKLDANNTFASASGYNSTQVGANGVKVETLSFGVIPYALEIQANKIIKQDSGQIAEYTFDTTAGGVIATQEWVQSNIGGNTGSSYAVLDAANTFFLYDSTIGSDATLTIDPSAQFPLEYSGGYMSNRAFKLEDGMGPVSSDGKMRNSQYGIGFIKNTTINGNSAIETTFNMPTDEGIGYGGTYTLATREWVNENGVDLSNYTAAGSINLYASGSTKSEFKMAIAGGVTIVSGNSALNLNSTHGIKANGEEVATQKWVSETLLGGSW